MDSEHLNVLEPGKRKEKESKKSSNVSSFLNGIQINQQRPTHLNQHFQSQDVSEDHYII